MSSLTSNSKTHQNSWGRTWQMRATTRAKAIASVAACAAIVGVSAPADAVSHGTTAAKVSPSKVSQQLTDEAARGGKVPVIVRLAVADPRELGPASHSLDSAKRAVRDTAHAVLDQLGHRPIALKTSSLMPVMAFHATAGELAALAKNPSVDSIVEDVAIPVAATSSRGAAAGQQLPSRWDFRRVRAGTAHSYGWTGAGQYVAVLDTGVDRSNPYLSNDVAEEACFSTGISGSGECPNGGTKQSGAGAATPCLYSSSCAHGTHVTHTAVGAYGVGKGARAIAVNVFHRDYDEQGRPTPKTYSSDQMWALNWVSRMRSNGWAIAAINMSLGGGNFYGYCDTASAFSDVGKWFDYLRTQGVTAVVSTGNENSASGVGKPACFRSALSVGNTTLDAAGYDAVFGGVRNGSNSGPTLDVLAPGTDICSAVPALLDRDGSADGWQCGWIGTSMAAPQVAGALADLRQYRPGATPAQLEAALKNSGVAVQDSRNGIVRQRLDVWGALNRLHQLIG